MRKLFPVVLCALLSACGAMPHHQELRTNPLSHLIVSGFSEGAVVYLDGNQVATVSKHMDPLVISQGTHKVEVREGGSVSYERELFIELGTDREIRKGG